jgi:hypothetical protein
VRAWLAVGAAALVGLPAPPPPDAVLPRDPAKLALELVRSDRDLGTAIDAWVANGTDRGGPPRDVTLLSLYEQRAYRLLARNPGLADRTVRLLPAALAAAARDTVNARRDLFRLTPPTRHRLRVGPALPAGALLADYREAQRRFGVDWHVLASVNFVESAFGRVRSSSSAGAQGPMQFLPATWHRYGLGGDVQDPHDAILGAANYLHANGAPHDLRRALYHYNPSRLYVDAVLRHARRMRLDPHAFYVFYSWQVFQRTPSGDVRLTGPGRG